MNTKELEIKIGKRLSKFVELVKNEYQAHNFDPNQIDKQYILENSGFFSLVTEKAFEFNQKLQSMMIKGVPFEGITNQPGLVNYQLKSKDIEDLKEIESHLYFHLHTFTMILDYNMQKAIEK